MSRQKRRPNRPLSNQNIDAIVEKIRGAIRSIVRDWQSLRKPLPVDAVGMIADTIGFQVRGAESYEELQERVIEFAGRVWQFKDGLIKWLETQPSVRFSFEVSGDIVQGAGGRDAVRTIEQIAKLSLPLLLCADLYNSYKHYDDCNRSGFQPTLSEVRLDTSHSGPIGICFDGARQSGELRVSRSNPVPCRIELHSGNQPVAFGDAVLVVGRGFAHWATFLSGIGLLSSSNVVDAVLLDDVATIARETKESQSFKNGADAININELSVEQRQLARTDVCAFIQSLRKLPPGIST